VGRGACKGALHPTAESAPHYPTRWRRHLSRQHGTNPVAAVGFGRGVRGPLPPANSFPSPARASRPHSRVCGMRPTGRR